MSLKLCTIGGDDHFWLHPPVYVWSYLLIRSPEIVVPMSGFVLLQVSWHKENSDLNTLNSTTQQRCLEPRHYERHSKSDQNLLIARFVDKDKNKTLFCWCIFGLNTMIISILKVPHVWCHQPGMYITIDRVMPSVMNARIGKWLLPLRGWLPWNIL